MQATTLFCRKAMALLLIVMLAAGTLTACGGSEESSAEATAQESTEDAAQAAEEELQESAEESAEDVPVEEEAAEEASDEEAAEEETPTEENAEAAGRSIADYVPGSWDGVNYTNETLGIQMTFPETYTIYTGDALNELMGQAVGMVTENSDIKNVNQTAMKYDFMAIAPDGVGNITFTVEENALELTPEDYVEALKATWDYAGVPYEMMDEIGTETIGDREYIMAAVALDYSQMTGVEGNTAIQAYMIHTDADFVYYFIVTFSEGTVDELGQIMDGIEPLA